MDQVEIDEYEEERKRWKLFGDHAEVLEAKENIILKDVKILIYDPKSHPELVVDTQITAQQGILEGKIKKVTLLGNVIAKKGDSMQMNSEKAVFDYQKDILFLPEKVIIHKEGNTLWGNALIYTLRDKRIRMNEVTLMQ